MAMICWVLVQGVVERQTSAMKTTFWGIVPTNSPSNTKVTPTQHQNKTKAALKKHQRNIEAALVSNALDEQSHPLWCSMKRKEVRSNQPKI
jgi:hypothetical protein